MKSNEELWDSVSPRKNRRWAEWSPEWQTYVADFAEAIRDEALAKAENSAAYALSGWGVSAACKAYVLDVIRNACKGPEEPPVLKPGMLVVDRRSSPDYAPLPFVLRESIPDSHYETLRACTRAEIMALHDKAPAAQPGSMDAEVQSYLCKAPE